MVNKEETYYGYMSMTQLQNNKEMNNKEMNNKEFRVNYYEDYQGNKVIISEVSSLPPEEYHNNFKDVVKLGKLKKWIKSEKF